MKGCVDWWLRAPRQPICRSVCFWRKTHAPSLARVLTLHMRLVSPMYVWLQSLQAKLNARPLRVLRLGLSDLSGVVAGTFSKMQASWRCRNSKLWSSGFLNTPIYSCLFIPCFCKVHCVGVAMHHSRLCRMYHFLQKTLQSFKTT